MPHTPPNLGLRWEYVRGALARPAQVAAGSGGVLLLVAIQHFHAGGAAKALVTGASFIGLLASPLAVALIARRRWTAAQGLAALLTPAGLALVIAGIGSSFEGFLLGVLVGAPLAMASSPLVTTVWRHNAHVARRGRLFGQATTLAGIAGIVSSLAISAWMGTDAGRYRPVVIALGLTLVAAGIASLRIPGHPIEDSRRRNPLNVLNLLWKHPIFGTLNVAWTLLGLGNLVTVPLRTEYLASGQHGLHYAPGQVLVLTVVLPQVGLLASTLVWGRLYDRMNFLVLRIVLNAFFIASILSFFGTSWSMQALGAVLYGIAEGGGSVVWNLWVTRYAPAARTADYMGVHTFLTGVRGLIAPMITYSLLGALDLMAVTNVGLALLVAANVLLVLIIPFDRPAEAEGLA